MSWQIQSMSEVGKGHEDLPAQHPARSRVVMGLRISEGGGTSAAQGSLCQGMAICTVNFPIPEIT